MTQPSLFHTSPRFDGPVYEPAQDHARLEDQHARIKALMADGEWRTLRTIATLTGYPEASISAQLRHLRKPRFGAHTVEKKRVTGGLWAYRVAS